MSKKAEFGDILEVALATEFAYLQFVGEDTFGMDVLRVLMARRQKHLEDVCKLADNATQYYAASSVQVLLEDTRFERIGNLPVVETPPSFRQRAIGGWNIIAAAKRTFVPQLDGSLADLPIAEGIPPDFIVERLIAGWRPADDQDDLLTTLKELMRGGRYFNEITFFLRFDNQAVLSAAKSELENRGFSVTESADGNQRSACLNAKIQLRYGDAQSEVKITRIETQVEEVGTRYGGVLEGHEFGSEPDD